MQLTIAPAQPTTPAPAFALPDATGHAARDRRLPVQRRSRRRTASRSRAEAKKSALVLVVGATPTRSSTSRSPAKETRVEFDLGADRRRRTASTSTAAAGSRRRSRSTSPSSARQGADDPARARARVSTPSGSELRLDGADELHVRRSGRCRSTVEQIGAHVRHRLDAATRLADDALELLGSLLYLARPRLPAAERGRHPRRQRPRHRRRVPLLRPRQRGVRGRPPARLRRAARAHGDRAAHDAAARRRRRASRCSSSSRSSSTRRSRSGPGSRSTALGGLIGIHRTLDADALRAGLRNHALDAVLFPKDPVANAGRLIASLRTSSRRRGTAPRPGRRDASAWGDRPSSPPS